MEGKKEAREAKFQEEANSNNISCLKSSFYDTCKYVLLSNRPNNLMISIAGFLSRKKDFAGTILN